MENYLEEIHLSIFIKIRNIAAVLMWLILLFLQHIVCFDFFNSNLWYLYLLAILFAIGQYLILFFLRKKVMEKWIMFIFLGLYAFTAIAKLLQIIYYTMFDGLSILCLFLDIAQGLILCVNRKFNN